LLDLVDEFRYRARLTVVAFGDLVERGPHSGAWRGGPLVEINCAALPHDLGESELFGHEAGAFTGAKGRRRGLMEQANGGTLFLDEICDLSLDLQAKLLTAIEDRRLRRLGGGTAVAIDVQIIAASNRDLTGRVHDNSFRSDLYHRIGVFSLDLPPLRIRKDDLNELVPLFVAEFNAKAGKSVRVIPDKVWEKMRAHDWPGNVRELRNAVERCVLMSETEIFPGQWLQLQSPDSPLPSDRVARIQGDRLCLPLDGSISLDEIDRHVIAAALNAPSSTSRRPSGCWARPAKRCAIVYRSTDSSRSIDRLYRKLP
jgi:two-component system response regulator AtoC